MSSNFNPAPKKCATAVDRRTGTSRRRPVPVADLFDPRDVNVVVLVRVIFTRFLADGTIVVDGRENERSRSPRGGDCWD